MGRGFRGNRERRECFSGGENETEREQSNVLLRIVHAAGLRVQYCDFRILCDLHQDHNGSSPQQCPCVVRLQPTHQHGARIRCPAPVRRHPSFREPSCHWSIVDCLGERAEPSLGLKLGGLRRQIVLAPPLLYSTFMTLVKAQDFQVGYV